jgi:hypothetical protein
MAAAAATDPAFQQVELDMYRLAGGCCTVYRLAGVQAGRCTGWQVGVARQ